MPRHLSLQEQIILELILFPRYNRTMLESVFQILAVYFFAATPCFAGWIANGGKREDIGIPIFASVFLSLLFGALIYFFV